MTKTMQILETVVKGTWFVTAFLLFGVCFPFYLLDTNDED